MKVVDLNHKQIIDFENTTVVNRVIKYEHNTSSDRCIFVPNWRAKSHHWDGFCNYLSQYINLDYFETREKTSTVFKTTTSDYNNDLVAQDIIHYLNTHPCYDYHLILCSFSVALVLSKWDDLIYKPKSLILICPITQVSLPWPVRLFSSIPKSALPYLHKMIYNLANKTSAVKPICKNHMDLFKKGNTAELSLFQSSVKEVLKLKVSYDIFEKVSIPTMIVKPMHDKIHKPSTCQKIKSKIANAAMHEVENFRKAHSIAVAKEIYHFIDSHMPTKKIVFRYKPSMPF